MTPTELNTFIDTYFNTAVNGFNNARMITVLKALVMGGLTGDVQTGADFQQQVTDNPDTPFMAYIENDAVYTGDTEVVLLYLPGRGVAQVAVDFDL